MRPRPHHWCCSSQTNHHLNFCQESKITLIAFYSVYLYLMIMDNTSDDIFFRLCFSISPSFGKMPSWVSVYIAWFKIESYPVISSQTCFNRFWSCLLEIDKSIHNFKSFLYIPNWGHTESSDSAQGLIHIITHLNGLGHFRKIMEEEGFFTYTKLCQV